MTFLQYLYIVFRHTLRRWVVHYHVRDAAQATFNWATSYGVCSICQQLVVTFYGLGLGKYHESWKISGFLPPPCAMTRWFCSLNCDYRVMLVVIFCCVDSKPAASLFDDDDDDNYGGDIFKQISSQKTATKPVSSAPKHKVWYCSSQYNDSAALLIFS